MVLNCKETLLHLQRAITAGGQTLFFPTVCGRKEVLRMRKKAFELFICAVIVLYIFLVKRIDRLAGTQTVNDLKTIDY